ncbi:MAG: hypothetical protein mread185_000591 [Mycoplasmataceae bacterium]|nr:MAG: hypothetical protein mread185_000591 [Mycoplasmataceae bacterium]
MYIGHQVKDMAISEIISQIGGINGFFAFGMTQLLLNEIAKQGSRDIKELSEQLTNNGTSMIRSGAMELLGEIVSNLSSALSARGLTKTADFVETANETYGIYNDTKPYFEVIKHFSHLSQGNEYVSDCDVCRNC